MDNLEQGLITVAETQSFITKAKRVMTEEEREDLIVFLSQNPLSGTIISNTGGVRKVRFGRKGQGKSGGFRVIYYFYTTKNPIYILTVFAKNEKDNITDAEKKEISALVHILKGCFRKGM